jgi:hypothetical protein
MNKKSYLARILDSNDSASSKRFITLVIAFHFILASFAILFLVCYVVLALPKGKVDPQLMTALETILEYDFYIILAGLGIITSEGLLSILVKRGLPQNNDVFPPDPPPPPPPAY